MESLTRAQLAYIALLEVSNRRLREENKRLQNMVNFIMLYVMLKDKLKMLVTNVKIKGFEIAIIAYASLFTDELEINSLCFEKDKPGNVYTHSLFSHYDPLDPSLPQTFVGASFTVGSETCIITEAYWSKRKVVCKYTPDWVFYREYGYPLPPPSKELVGHIRSQYKVSDGEEGTFKVKKGLFICLNNPLVWEDIEEIRVEGGVTPVVSLN